MATSLTYVIKFVEDMDRAVQFHIDKLELKLRFKSPEWSEFDTGTTTLALHIASEGTRPEHASSDLVSQTFSISIAKHRATVCSSRLHLTDFHGQRIAKLRDVDGAECSVSGP